MKMQMDKTLRFCVEAAYGAFKRDHPKRSKGQVISSLLRQFEERGEAMRYLNAKGRIAWKASPKFLEILAEEERDAQYELDEFLDYP
jgi:hypothetical protein